MEFGGEITRQAISRHGLIGSLYDIRTDKFEGGNLFYKELPSSPFIESVDDGHASYCIDSNNSQKETFDKLNIEAGLKLSIMGGLVNVEGSAKYLTQQKPTAEQFA